MSVKSSVTVPLGGSDMSLHYRAARGTRQVEASVYCRRLQLYLGRFAAPQLAASLGRRDRYLARRLRCVRLLREQVQLLQQDLGVACSGRRDADLALAELGRVAPRRRDQR